MDRVHEHREQDEEMIDNDALSDEEMSDDDELSDESASIDDECVPDDEIWSQIEGNDSNLTSLRVGYDDFQPPSGDWAQLGRAIGRNTHLRELFLPRDLPKEYFADFCRGLASNESIQTFRLNMTGVDDHEANILANGIIRNAPLKALAINFAPFISHIGWHAIFAALQTNPNCRLQKLDLARSSINDAAALSLSNVLLRHNTTLKTLELSDCINTITIAGFATLIQPLQDLHCRMENLHLSINSITDEMVVALTNALANNSSLRELDLSLNRDVTPTGWSAFSTVLRNPNSALEKLGLGANEINDNVMFTFADALANNSMLRELDLSCNSDVTAMGWSVLSAVLRNPNSALEKLDLFDNQINDNVMITFAHALANNNRLRDLFIDSPFDPQEDINEQDIDYIDCAAFTNILCNTSSILSTYRSNHTLEKLCHIESNEEYVDEDLRSLLELNSKNSKSQAARLKIIKTHFSGSEINTQIFVDMESKVLPTAIAWMGQDDGKNGISDVLFAFLRSLPLLCDMKKESKMR